MEYPLSLPPPPPPSIALRHHYLYPNQAVRASPSPPYDIDDPYESESEFPKPASRGHLLALDEYESELHPEGWPKDIIGAYTILEKITPITTVINLFIDTILPPGFIALFAGFVQQAQRGLAEGRGEWRMRGISMAWSFSRGHFTDTVWEALATLPRDLPFLRTLNLEGNELPSIHPCILLSIRLYARSFRLLLDGNCFDPAPIISFLILHSRQYPNRPDALAALDLGLVPSSELVRLLSMGRNQAEEVDVRLEQTPQDSLPDRLRAVLQENYWIRRLSLVLMPSSVRLDVTTTDFVKSVCARNVLLRRRTRRAALILLSSARPVLLALKASSQEPLSIPGPSASSPLSLTTSSISLPLQAPRNVGTGQSPDPSQTRPRVPSPVALLRRIPYELVISVLAQLNPGDLSSRQIERVCRWAEDRGTLGQAKAVQSRKGFLRTVDCMRWESERARINEGLGVEASGLMIL